MESIQTKMLQATKPVQDQPTPIFKTEELAPNVIDDYHTITKKVTEDICDALLTESQHVPPNNQKTHVKNFQRFNDSIDDIFKQDVSYHKINGSFTSFESPQKIAEQDNLAHLMSSEEFPGVQFNDLSSIEIEQSTRKISVTSSSEEASSSDREKETTETIKKNCKRPKKRSSRHALNETNSTIKSNSSSCYSIWQTLTSKLTGNKRLRNNDLNESGC